MSAYSLTVGERFLRKSTSKSIKCLRKHLRVCVYINQNIYSKAYIYIYLKTREKAIDKRTFSFIH